MISVLQISVLWPGALLSPSHVPIPCSITNTCMHPNATQLSNIVCTPSAPALSTSRSFPSVGTREGAQHALPQCHWYGFQIVNTLHPPRFPILVLARLLELGTGTFSVTREYPHRNPMRLHDVVFMICSVRVDGANGPRWKSDHVLLTSHS